MRTVGCSTPKQPRSHTAGSYPQAICVLNTRSFRPSANVARNNLAQLRSDSGSARRPQGVDADMRAGQEDARLSQAASSPPLAQEGECQSPLLQCPRVTRDGFVETRTLASWVRGGTRNPVLLSQVWPS